jgi:hypothetical protein
MQTTLYASVVYIYEGLEMTRDKDQLSVLLYSNTLGWMCDRGYRGYKTASKIPPVSTTVLSWWFANRMRFS